MVTRKDVETLIGRGYYEDALYAIGDLDDPLDKVELLVMLAVAVGKNNGPEDWIPEIIDDAVYLAEKLKDPLDRASAFASIGSAMGELGYEESEEFFARAIDEAENVEDPLGRGALLANVAYYLALGGYTKSALDVFNVAFDTIIGAEVAYSKKVDGIIRIAELMETAGDDLPSEDAVRFYEGAFDIFDKLHVSQRAAMVEKKLALARTVRIAGRPEIRSALLEGRYRYVLALVKRLYRGTPCLIASLEVALWMKRMNVSDYLSTVEEAFGNCGSSPLGQGDVERLAVLLAELELFDRALRFARAIEDEEKASRVMKIIAVGLARKHDYEGARSVAERIPHEKLRSEALMEIATLEGGA